MYPYLPSTHVYRDRSFTNAELISAARVVGLDRDKYAHVVDEHDEDYALLITALSALDEVSGVNPSMCPSVDDYVIAAMVLGVYPRGWTVERICDDIVCLYEYHGGRFSGWYDVEEGQICFSDWIAAATSNAGNEAVMIAAAHKRYNDLLAGER